ncbi:MAG: hypothetical protein LBF94_01325 [Puniceicoccales bacterium]|jgi:hypothetical protein|nr:hypothetical protein [Puniceicoccales bacterium]
MGDSGNVKMSGTGLFKHGVTIESLYSVLASYLSAYEETLGSAIEGLGSGSEANQIDQGRLLSIQAKVQTWGTIVTTATGIVRAAGDAMKSTAQNIR